MPEPAADVDQGPRPKVVYVMGAGRSGSTIIGVALGNCEQVFYAGEVDKWLLRSGRPKLEDEPRLRFWEGVLARVAAPEPLFGSRVHIYLERSSALFRRAGRSARAQLRGPYRRTMGELFAAIASTAGATHVVDSSHYPLRARELQSVPEIDLYLLLLVRDPRRVIASFAREDVVEPRFAPNKTRAYLLLTYLLSVLVFWRHPRDRRMVLFHEDFLANPAGTLRAILDHVGSDAALPDLARLSTGMALQGNRLLQQELVAVEARPQQEPLGRRGPVELAIVALLSRLRPRIVAGRER
jgi:Sulfotransferase family